MPQRDNNHEMLITFEVDSQQYAVGSSCVERVTAMAALYRPAGVPKVLKGFLDLGGEPVPVICLHTLFELPDPVLGKWTPLVIFRSKTQRLAFPVDKVNRIIKVDKAALLPLPANHVFNECVEGVVWWDNDSILLLSPDRLLLEKENQTITEFQEMAARRMNELEGAEA